MSSADGGAAITDAVIETQALVHAGYKLAGATPPSPPKSGARFSFAYPGSVQGFRSEPGDPSVVQPVTLENVEGHAAEGGRSLAIRFRALSPGRVARACTRTSFDEEVFGMRTYQLMCSPTLYPGQDAELRVAADEGNTGGVRARVYLNCFGANDRIDHIAGPAADLRPGTDAVLRWRVPETGGRPVYEIGVELEPTAAPAVSGTVYLDYVKWDGAPDTVFRRPDAPGIMWTHAWVDDASHFQTRWKLFRVSQEAGLGMIIQGARSWRDYEVEATIKPMLADAWGLGARVQGRRRFMS